MQVLWQDLRYGARMLWNNPAFTAAALIALALGIGANTTVFSVVNALLVRPLPFKDAERLVYVWETNSTIGLERGIVSPADFTDWRQQNEVFEHISAWRTWFYRLSGGGSPEQVWGVRASANFFDLLEVEPAFGRTFLPEEQQPGRDQIVIISHSLWERRFGADPGIVGQTITIDDRPLTVIGILPRHFNLFGTTRSYDVWMPFDFERGPLRRDDYSLIVFARLKPRVHFEQAQAEMSKIAANLEQRYPENQNRGVKVITLQENQVSSLRPALLILMAIAGFVLLIACTNVANLLLARAATRQKEIAVRMALGASRGRLVRQVLTESVLLASLGGVLAMPLAFWVLNFLRAAVANGADAIPRSDWISIDRTVLGFSLLVSLLTGIAFGLAPALQVSRSDLNRALNDNGKSTTVGVRERRVRDSLVVAEIALATVLLLMAGLMIRSFGKLVGVEPGFEADNVLTMQIWLPESKYSDGNKIARFYQQVLERISAVPRVKSASAIDFLPSSGWGDSTVLTIDGRAAPAKGQANSAEYRVIDCDYFRTMGIPLLKGRSFDQGDRDEGEGVALINDAMARRYWPGEDPIGKRIRPDFPETTTPWRPKAGRAWLTIVGVVRDVKEFGPIAETPAEFYLPYPQNPSALMRLVVRTEGPPTDLASTIRDEVLAVDPDQPVTEIKTMNEFISESVFRRRFNTTLLGVFAAVALILAIVGVYGAMSYSVTQRKREVGIRMALGATSRQVLSMTVVQGMKLCICGLAIGVGGALALTSVMKSLLFGVSTTDALTYVIATLLLGVMSLLACYVPARRVTKIDPMEALRYE